MSGHERERLSAYLDGELAPAERAAGRGPPRGLPRVRGPPRRPRGRGPRRRPRSPPRRPRATSRASRRGSRSRLEAGAAAARRRAALPAWTWAAAAALLLAVVTPLTLRQPRPGPVASPVATAPAGSLARESRRAERSRRRRQTCRRRHPPCRPRGPRPPREARPRATSAREPPSLRPGCLPPRRGPTLADAAVAQAPLAAPDGGCPARSQVGAQCRRGAAAGPPQERSAESAGLAAVGGAADSEHAFRRLDAVRPRSADGWRRLRDEWAAFVSAHPETPLADEARVRAIEAGYEAWRTAGDPDDEAAFRRDARAYLERADAPPGGARATAPLARALTRGAGRGPRGSIPFSRAGTGSERADARGDAAARAAG